MMKIPRNERAPHHVAPRPNRRNNSDLRHRCRNPKCRGKLPVPTDNPRRAFCTRFCFDQHYRTRCVVCEKDISKNPLTGKARANLGRRKYCGRKHKAEAARFPHIFAWGDHHPVTSPIGSRSAHSTGLKTALKPGRHKQWHQVAGPELSPTAFRLATLEPLPTACRPSGLEATARARPIIGPRTMPPQVRSVREWLEAGCPVVEVTQPNAVLLTASSRIAESKVFLSLTYGRDTWCHASDPGPIPDFLVRQPAADEAVSWTGAASTSPMVSIYDGQRCVGFVYARGKQGFEAIDCDQRSLGMFATQREAVTAVMEAQA